MSRLRRVALSECYFFVTSNLARKRTFLREPEFRKLCSAIADAREAQGFWVTAWVLLPDHWHAIVYPRYPLTISSVLKTIKLRSTSVINQRLREAGLLWLEPFVASIQRSSFNAGLKQFV